MGNTGHRHRAALSLLFASFRPSPLFPPSLSLILVRSLFSPSVDRIIFVRTYRVPRCTPGPAIRAIISPSANKFSAVLERTTGPRRDCAALPHNVAISRSRNDKAAINRRFPAGRGGTIERDKAPTTRTRDVRFQRKNWNPRHPLVMPNADRGGSRTDERSPMRGLGGAEREREREREREERH